MQPTNDKHLRIRSLIRTERRRQSPMWTMFLSDLDGRQADKKIANKFLLGCILDYQMRVEVVWENARRFAEDDLDDPRDLWHAISAIPKWHTERVWRRYNLHRFPAAHDRVRKIALKVKEHYRGDARKIWKGQSACETQKRLERIGVGPQLSRMTAGILLDTKQITGAGELKADIHVRRVLGRVFTGDIVSAAAALDIANRMLPGGSWKLDAQLFRLGNLTARKHIRTVGTVFSERNANSTHDRAVEKSFIDNLNPNRSARARQRHPTSARGSIARHS